MNAGHDALVLLLGNVQFISTGSKLTFLGRRLAKGKGCASQNPGAKLPGAQIFTFLFKSHCALCHLLHALGGMLSNSQNNSSLFHRA